MPHLHLSLQAGDDMILKRMKRRHSRGQAIAFCDQVRRLRPDAVFGGDIIAGFPTETEEMFERSLDLVDEYRLMLTPNLLGGGKRLFESGLPRIPLALIETRPLDTGAVILHYRRDRTA